MEDHYPPGLVPVEEAARRLGVSEEWIRKAGRERRIEFVRVGARMLFRPAYLDEYIADHTSEPTVAASNV